MSQPPSPLSRHLVADLHTSLTLLKYEEANRIASQRCQPSSLQGSRAGGCPSLGADPPHPPARPRHTSATSSPLPLATRANTLLLPPSAPEHSTKDPSAARTYIRMRILRPQLLGRSSFIRSSMAWKLHVWKNVPHTGHLLACTGNQWTVVKRCLPVALPAH